MDPLQFDNIVRTSSGHSSRRAIAGLLAAGLAATAGITVGAAKEHDDLEAEVLGLCKLPTQTCDKSTQCCSHKCVEGQCTCKPKGSRCYSAIGIVCCSRKCKKGRCK